SQLFASFQTVSEAGAFLYRKGGSPEPQTPWLAPPLPALPEPPGDLEAAGTESPGQGQALPARAEFPGTFQPHSAPQASAGEAVDDLDSLRQLADQGRWEEAEGLCRRLVERRRLDPLVHLYRGLVAEQRGRPQEAEQALRQAVYLDRRGPLAHYHLGLLLQRQGRSAEARRSLRNVVELLNGADPARVLPHADGLTCGDLRELARMQLEVEEL
ncbi:MAG TPA: tetratricopeptide repeat protein, partial [Candidatus Nitrosotenuis sp.]|nr:tetratricopeptide repeat protein [Candidatus Nitrosotenuis sp.]